MNNDKILCSALVKVYALWAKELKSKYKRVSMLFKHGPSIGRSREVYLAQILQKCLLANLDVCHGAYYIPGYGASSEQDILIVDKNQMPPIEKIGDFGIYYAATVKACIEIKSKLTKKELRKGIEKLVKDRKLGGGSNRRYILFAYETTMSAQSILDLIKNTEDFFDYRPSLIVVLGRFVFAITDFYQKNHGLGLL